MKKEMKEKMKKEIQKKDSGEKDAMISFQISRKDLVRVERLADRLKISRSQFVRSLISTGLDDVELAEAFGLISLVAFIRRNDITPSDLIGLAAQKSAV